MTKRCRCDSSILVRYCDAWGRRKDISADVYMAGSMIPQRWAKFRSGGREFQVRRRLWLTPDEVELHCREVRA